jgi:uroporphyrin-III C-methyltransferase
LTTLAVGLLETADVVFHDDLVSDEVLKLVHRHAVVTSVGKRCGRP